MLEFPLIEKRIGLFFRHKETKTNLFLNSQTQEVDAKIVIAFNQGVKKQYLEELLKKYPTKISRDVILTHAIEYSWFASSAKQEEDKINLVAIASTEL